jgi:frataxin-like iron-binding protein CyaY
VLEKLITRSVPEKRIALIHRVILPDREYPKEYAILVTDSRSVFIRLEKTRSSYWLRAEMRFGTALITDVVPKTLEDYEQTSLESLAANNSNFTVSHEDVTSLVLRKEEPEFRAREFFVWLTMRRQGHRFQVYNFEMNYAKTRNDESKIRFYMVPLGAYFKPRRQTQSRETILREYAVEALGIFRKVLPAEIVSSSVVLA